MAALHSLHIFSILFLTACTLERASSLMYCGKSPKIQQGRQGEIYSSNIHGSAGPVNCSWTIISEVGERVILSFSEFTVKCGREWVNVAPLTGTPISLCGDQLPKPMELYGANITVTHHYNPRSYSFTPIVGFRLSYIKDSGPCYPGEFECYSERCLPASWHCNGQVECLGEGDELGSDEEGCDLQSHMDHNPSTFSTKTPTSVAVDSDTEEDNLPQREPNVPLLSQGGPCGGYLQAFYGSFVPPALTGAQMECVWTVDPQDPRPLKLELQQLELGPIDTLIITDQPYGAGNVIKIITSTSNYKTVEVESKTGLLSLTYRAQADSEGRGFNATYRIADYCLPWEGLCKGSEGGCYTQKQRCDGHWDCPETGRDEEGCGGCSAGHFPCGGGQKTGHSMGRRFCYTAAERCNYRLNCADGSDERECTVCRPGTFHCDSDRCVFESWRCDGQEDCKDGTDEMNCTVFCLPAF